jgi:hypothetical protein
MKIDVRNLGRINRLTFFDTDRIENYKGYGEKQTHGQRNNFISLLPKLAVVGAQTEKDNNRSNNNNNNNNNNNKGDIISLIRLKSLQNCGDI